MNLKTTELNFTVHTYDIDIAGHVNNIVYVRWLEEMRNKLLTENFKFRKIIYEKLYHVVISTNICYKKQIRLFDEPSGVMEFIRNIHGIITLKAIIKLKDKVAAIAEQKCVIINLRDSKMISQNKFYELTNLE